MALEIDTGDQETKPGRIDDNITKALKVLRSPRLSIPSGEKDANAPDSARKSYNGDADNFDSKYGTRHGSSHLPSSQLKDYGHDGQLRRYRSTSFSKHSRSNSRISKNEKKDEEDLAEFLALEKTCKDTDQPSSNLLSLNSSPVKDLYRSKSNKRPSNRAEMKIDLKSQIYNDSRNGDYFKPKRGTCEDLEKSISLLEEMHLPNASKKSKKNT